MEIGDRIVWRPAWDASANREGVVLVAPGGQAEASGAFTVLGPEAVAVRFDEPLDGTRDYIISTTNVEVIP